MKRTEKLDDPVIAFIEAFQGVQAGLWTALPGKVDGFSASKQTVSVKPMIQAQVTAKDGTTSWIDLPLLVDVPAIFPSGGGYSLTFPVKAGDECLVVFASRNIDSWWSQSKGAPVNDLRMHDLSDGFAILGPRSQPKAIPSIATDGVVLRNDSGASSVKITDAGNIIITSSATVTVNASSVNVNGSSAITLTAPVVNVNGNLTVSGTSSAASVTTTGEITAAGKHLSTHVHGGVQGGSSNTGAPV